MPKKIECDFCERKFDREEMREAPDCGDILCQGCFGDNYIDCCGCSDTVHMDESYYSDAYGVSYCGDCFWEDHFECEPCGDYVATEYGYWSEGDGQYYCEGCYDNYAPHNVDLNSFSGRGLSRSQKGNTFSVNKFERLVGVEIETLGIMEADDEHPSSFRRSCDGSISGDYGFEYISNPMSGDYLFEEIDKMSDYLWRRDYDINRSCGLHIHIDARDLFYKELVGIMLVAKSFEETIFSMMPNSRQSSNWCRKFPIDKRSIRNIESDSEFIEIWYDACGSNPSFDKYNDARYHGLNLHARVYLGTIEFRYHSGTNNPTKIKNWITICQSIVEKGITLSKELGKKPEDWDANTHLLMNSSGDLGLQAFIEILELDTIKDYIVRRVRKFDRPSTEESRQYITNYI